MVLLNTCSIREKAVNKVYTELGYLREVKRPPPPPGGGFTGCLAQQEKDRALPPGAPDRFRPGHHGHPAAAQAGGGKRGPGRTKVIDTGDYPDHHLFPPGTTLHHSSTAKALVTIIEGCDPRLHVLHCPLHPGGGAPPALARTSSRRWRIWWPWATGKLNSWGRT